MNTIPELLAEITAYFSRPGARLARAADGNTCQYRTAAGLKCAVGCLIPDAEYDPCFEDCLLEDVIIAVPRFDGIDDIAIEFLMAAQEVHDSSLSVEQFLDRLHHIADFESEED